MFLGCPVVPFICLSIRLSIQADYVTTILVNGLNNFDKTYRDIR